MGRSRRLPDGKRAVRAWSRGSRAARPAQTRALPVTCGLRIRDQAPWLPQGTGPARTRAGPPQQGLAQGWPPLRTPSGTSVVNQRGRSRHRAGGAIGAAQLPHPSAQDTPQRGTRCQPCRGDPAPPILGPPGDAGPLSVLHIASAWPHPSPSERAPLFRTLWAQLSVVSLKTNTEAQRSAHPRSPKRDPPVGQPGSEQPTTGACWLLGNRLNSQPPSGQGMMLQAVIVQSSDSEHT